MAEEPCLFIGRSISFSNNSLREEQHRTAEGCMRMLVSLVCLMCLMVIAHSPVSGRDISTIIP